MQRDFFVSLAWLLAWTTASAASPIDCRQGHCDLLRNGAYPAVVIATVDHVGTPAELGAVQRWAERHRGWRKLPHAVAPYLAAARLIAVTLPAPAALPLPTALLMGRDEFAAVPLEAGDLVRYAPHRRSHETPSGDAAARAVYWGVTGCIAVLCKARDPGCFARYRPGFYSRESGQPLDPLRRTPRPGGLAVDTGTWLPVTASGGPH